MQSKKFLFRTLGALSLSLMLGSAAYALNPADMADEPTVTNTQAVNIANFPLMAGPAPDDATVNSAVTDQNTPQTQAQDSKNTGQTATQTQSPPAPAVLTNSVAAPSSIAAPVKAATNIVSYTVKKGDTLYVLAQRFSSTVSAIKSTNGLKTDTLYIGQVLKIPQGNKATVSNTTSYTVKKSDTLYLIAKKFGTTVPAIKSANGLKTDTLYIGQVLKIPSGNAQPIAAQSGSYVARPASSSRSDVNRSEVLLLAKLIHAESRGEPYLGQVAVGAVVLNRVKSSLFPNSIAEVIYQPYEFSAVLDGQINLQPDASSIKAAEDALGGFDPTYGALYYWNPAKAPNNQFLNSRPVTTVIGNHVFAR